MVPLRTSLPLLAAPRDSLYGYWTGRSFVTMPDGARLAVTWWRPVARHPDYRFPAPLQLLPYRKDDGFCAGDFPLYDYFMPRGFLMAKVDVRDTMTSAPTRPQSPRP